FLWAGSIHRVVHRYNPRTGETQSIKIPYDSSASACLCVGDKVYILGQSYPRLIIHDRKAGTFREAEYPSPKPDVWYGNVAPDGRHLYLFDRGSVGVIKCDSRTDTGQSIPWPYKTPPPSGGRIEPRDNALWCYVWDFGGGQYKPLGIARLDLATDSFTGWYPFQDDEKLESYGHTEETFFLPHTLRGRIVPFDFKQKRWCKPLEVPRHGELFGFLGGPVVHEGRSYFSMSTYNGTETGCDGKPYHFCNSILEFDPKTRRFEFLTMDAEDAYYQLAYMLSAGGEFFVTGTNIQEPDGSLNRDRAAEVVFWQTVRVEAK
ncbi:MAG TPA: hypothetical protein VFT74_17535, partial [Isosphaeraceae bacterium]|nr:hypothetical protein [Isosphaeraceae bacterium]